MVIASASSAAGGLSGSASPARTRATYVSSGRLTGSYDGPCCTPIRTVVGAASCAKGRTAQTTSAVAVSDSVMRDMNGFSASWRGAIVRGSGSEEALTPVAAPAPDQPFAVGVVVVGELLPFSNPPGRADPNHTVADVDVAVGSAGVVDVARDVSADAGVDDRPVRELEAPDVTATDVAALAFEALAVRDLLAGVVHDPSVLVDGRRCVHTPTVNARSSPLDHRT